jgi:hypothetical protein
VAIGAPAQARQAGDIAIADSRLAAPGGVTLSAANLLAERSDVRARVTGDEAGGAVDVAAADILLDASRIGTATAGTGPRRGRAECARPI